MNMDELQLAKDLFNQTWDLIDKTDRTRGEDALMLHKAHASCLLWRGAGKPVNNAVGEWQVSHAYCLLGMGAPALLHAELSLAICKENDIGGLTLAFGYEGLARAYAVLGDAGKSAEYKAAGLAICDTMEDERDREYVRGELNNIG